MRLVTIDDLSDGIKKWVLVISIVCIYLGAIAIIGNLASPITIGGKWECSEWTMQGSVNEHFSCYVYSPENNTYYFEEYCASINKTKTCIKEVLVRDVR